MTAAPTQPRQRYTARLKLADPATGEVLTIDLAHVGAVVPLDVLAARALKALRWAGLRVRKRFKPPAEPAGA